MGGALLLPRGFHLRLTHGTDCSCSQISRPKGHGRGSVGRKHGQPLFPQDLAGRGTRRFIIDPDGVIQGMEVLTPSVGRNVAELIRQVKAFQLVRQTGEATPSGWQPGKPTLKPNPQLVGRVWEIWKPEMAF
jgi:hypothetical protein